MEPLGNDRWAGRFLLEENTRYVYTIEAWPDAYRSWAEDLRKRLAAGMDVTSELLEGAALLRGALARVVGADRRRLEARLERGRGRDRRRPPCAPAAQRGDRGDPRRLPGPRGGDAVRPGARGGGGPLARPLRRLVRAVPAVAESSAGPTRHLPGLHRAAAGRSPAWASTCSICRRSIRSADSFRKGRNNALEAGPDDPGSPWAIGNEHGGHKAIEPALGTLDDFRRLRPRRPRPRDGGRARLRAPVLARPPLGDGASRVVPPPTRRDDQVRGEPAEEVPGHLPAELLRPGARGALGGVRRGSSSSGSSRGSASSAWTTRTRSRSRSGTWVIAEVQAVHPDVIFLAEAFTRPRVDAGPREGRLHPVVHLLHVAELQARS